jgi:hypothetical protein
VYNDPILSALVWCAVNHVSVPRDTLAKIEEKGIHIPMALKADGDISGVNAAYHDAITEALTAYFEEGGSVAGPKNAIKQAVTEAFGAAFDTGWVDGGGELPADEDALDWFNARVEQEYGFIDVLLEQAKQLRKEEEPDWFTWLTSRADSFTATVGSIYNAAVLFAKKNQMLEWSLGNTEKHCATCSKLDGGRHRASWYIAHDYIPRKPGANLDCGGFNCDCSLVDDQGNELTI